MTNRVCLLTFTQEMRAQMEEYERKLEALLKSDPAEYNRRMSYRERLRSRLALMRQNRAAPPQFD